MTVKYLNYYYNMNGLYNPNMLPTLNGIKADAKEDPLGSWSFQEDRDNETLTLRKNNKIMFRFLHEPYNLFARVSNFTVYHNGNYGFVKQTKI